MFYKYSLINYKIIISKKNLPFFNFHFITHFYSFQKMDFLFFSKEKTCTKISGKSSFLLPNISLFSLILISLFLTKKTSLSFQNEQEKQNHFTLRIELENWIISKIENFLKNYKVIK